MTRHRNPEAALVSVEAMASAPTSEIVGMINDIGSLLGALGTQARSLENKRAVLRSIVRDREKPDFTVSDHAVIRWLERVEKLDLDTYREKIVEAVKTNIGASTEAVRPEHKGNNAARLVSAGKLRFIVTCDNNNVVTCFRED